MLAPRASTLLPATRDEIALVGQPGHVCGLLASGSRKGPVQAQLTLLTISCSHCDGNVVFQDRASQALHGGCEGWIQVQPMPKWCVLVTVCATAGLGSATALTASQEQHAPEVRWGRNSSLTPTDRAPALS
jgi:hypothetical protein